MPPVRFRMRPLVAIISVVLTLAAGVGLAVIAFGVPLNPIPTPEGPFAVGSIEVLFTDPHRPEIFAQANVPRRVPAQILYPIAKAESGRAPYIAHPRETLKNMSRIHGVLLATLLKGIIRLDAPWSIARAPAAASQLPVIVYLPGVTGYREMNSFQTMDLASHGYVVIALDQPGSVAASVMPDSTIINGLDLAEIKGAVPPAYLANAQIGLPPHLARWRSGERSIIPYLAADASLVVDQISLLDNDHRSPLKGKLNMRRVGIFGMSLGAIVAARTCADDQRFGACLMMDAPTPIDVARDGLPQPALWLTRTADLMREERHSTGGWPDDEIAITQRSIHDAARHSRDGVVIDMPGTFHISFTDLAALTPILRWLGIAPGVNARATHRNIATLTRLFFDQKLKPAPAAERAALKTSTARPSSLPPAHTACRPPPARL